MMRNLLILHQKSAGHEWEHHYVVQYVPALQTTIPSQPSSHAGKVPAFLLHNQGTICLSEDLYHCRRLTWGTSLPQ